MSEVVQAPVPPAVGGAGRLLREARESAGLHVAALAVSLKVPVRKLEALEEDRYEEVGEPVFVRALAASVCRALKVEAQPVLERLPQGARPRLVADSEGINTPFRAPGDGATTRWADQLGRPVLLVVGALLLGALVLLFLPKVQRLELLASPPAGAPALREASDPGRAATPATPGEPAMAAPGTAAPAPEAATAAPVAAAPGLAAPDVPASAAGRPAGPASAAQAAPEVAAAASLTAAAATVPPPAASGAASMATGTAVPAAGAEILSFHTTGPSWIEVTDARGGVALRRMVGAGETATAGGPPPLKVTVGKADLTQVQVRGRPFDLQPVTRENVARFEVK